MPNSESDDTPVQDDAEPGPIELEEVEVVDTPTIADINEIMISLKNVHSEILNENMVLMSALDIIREDQRIASNENKQILLALTEVVGQLNQRLDSLEGLFVRKLGQLEFSLQKPPPEPMTDVMKVLSPQIIEAIRKEEYQPYNTRIDQGSTGYDVKEHPEDVLGGVKRRDDDEGPTIHDLVKGVPKEILDAYHAWKHGDEAGSSGWHAFMRVCKGAKEAKAFKDQIESQL
tara:strand:- start:225 stop:917 length:693 start_codon:yes stop_codon:yes gene_type:complete